jgi:YbbR domain-containing protein
MRYHPFANFGLKAASIAMAFCLWLLVSQGTVVERGLRIPVELQNVPATLKMVQPPQDAVDVRLRGPSDTLGRLAAGDVIAQIDLAAATEGTHLYEVSPDRVRVPFGVEVSQVSPSAVAIEFEPAAERQLENVVVGVRNTGPGLLARANPAAVSVRARGSEAALGQLREDEVEAYVDVAGLGPGRYGLAVRLEAGEDLQFDRPDPSAVDVQIESGLRAR